MTDQAFAYTAPALVRPLRPAEPPPLTRRQKECLTWVEQGKSSSDIGVILSLSPETVNEHVAEACRRLGVRTRIQAVVAARARGLFE